MCVCVCVGGGGVVKKIISKIKVLRWDGLFPSLNYR